MEKKPKSMLKGIKDDARFLKGWAKDPKGVGSIKPTSKPAAKLMVSQIPKGNDFLILELGPGTGIITKTMIDSGIDPNRITSIECEKNFVVHLKKSMPEVNFIEGNAFDLDSSLKDEKGTKFGAILSGIPLLNFSKSDRRRLLIGGLNWLKEGHPFVQLSYGPKAPVEIKETEISVEPTNWVLANVPPARFWVYRKISKAN